MDGPTPEFAKTVIKNMEDLGPAQVRALIQSGEWALSLKPLALQWLKSKDDEAERLQAASQNEMAAAASRANEAADRAASAAERAATAAESQAVAAAEQASSAREQTRIAHQALITARIAAAIGAVALIATIAAYLHPIH